MGKLLITENGQTIVRNFTHYVTVSPQGRLGRTWRFEGVMHLTNDGYNRLLRVSPYGRPLYSFWERVIRSVCLLVTGAALYKLWVLL